MSSPDICACITTAADIDAAVAVKDLVALYEVRIDLIGEQWLEVARALPGPWIACNRLSTQGGGYCGTEIERVDVLQHAIEVGASIVDIEMEARDARSFIRGIKGRATVLVSHHDFEKTDEGSALTEVVERQKDLGADICKIVTTARSVEDTVTVLRLARRYSAHRIVTFAMGISGMTSRILAPLVGAQFTYASLAAGREAAPGQLTVAQLRAVYDAMGVI